MHVHLGAMNRPTIAIGDVLVIEVPDGCGFQEKQVTVTMESLEDVRYLNVVAIIRNGKKIWPVRS